MTEYDLIKLTYADLALQLVSCAHGTLFTCQLLELTPAILVYQLMQVNINK